ncbi:hypothetical protein AX15_002326 [Amanita polypyramis BW_CC]|nr:hypothetical protein AX15_002326 [Amanita polypyramis BW_CC]
MGQRIRQLEDALAILYSGTSNETHPLLCDDLMAIKFGPEKVFQVEERKPVQEGFADLIDAVGTLTISPRGVSKYFGRSAGTEALILAGAEFMTDTEADGVDLEGGPRIQRPRIIYCDVGGPPGRILDLTKLSSAFPFGVLENTGNEMDLLFSHLPHQARAWSLCETFIEHACWIFCPIRRDEIVDDILTPIYKALKERKASKSISQQPMISVHKLAILFLVFAIGSLVDLTLESFHDDADRYYQLSRVCLSLQSVLDSLEVATVQAVLLMVVYHNLCGKRYTMDNLWSLISLGAKLAQSLGLHRDSARWNMDAKTVERRRALFWEMYTTELIYCLALGRPPSIRLSYVDCEFPEDREATLDANGSILIGFYRWKYEFAKEVISSLVELTLGAKPPSYQTILDLDREVREKTLPPHLNVFITPEDERFTPSTYMRGCILGQYRAHVLLYIHKSFFAQAVLDFPGNPLRSPYAPSFLAAYRCASGVIKTCNNHFDRFPDLCCRWWNIWTILFTAAVIVGSVVTRSPSSSIASSAFIDLSLAWDLYEKAAVHTPRARSGRAILRKLKEKAHRVYSSRNGHVPASPELLTSGKPDYGDDELALFGGQTRVLALKLLHSRHPTQSNPPCSAPSPLLSSSGSEYKDSEVHPSLFKYLSNLAPQYADPDDATVNSGTQISNPQVNTAGFPELYMPPSQTTSPEIYQVQNWPRDGQSYIQPQTGTDPEILPFSNEARFGVSVDLPDQAEFNMMTSGYLSMDGQWISLIRDSGLLDSSLNST